MRYDMADNKDRQQQKKMKVLLLKPSRESSTLLPHNNNSTSSSSPNPRHEVEVAPLGPGHAGSPSPASDPVVPTPSAEEKASKKRKLKDVWETILQSGPNGSVKAGMNSSAVFRSLASNNNDGKKDGQNPSWEVTASVPGTPSELQPVSAIPDKKILLVALDKFQKKDTYGVFSEPVDPREVPDYYEFIKNPMDFGTIRKKLDKGIYVTLEQFEKDVFLVCSNAMSYNASCTIYYRQARSIQDLARKTFQTLRLNPEGIEVENARKPALKNKTNYISRSTKKSASGTSHFEPIRTDFSSGATLASSGDRVDRSNPPLHNLVKTRKGTPLERPGGYSDVTGWIFQGHHGADGNSPAEQSEEFSGSILKATALKDGRRDLLWEENRRGTYKPWNVLANGNEPMFAKFGRDSKQLIPTGIQWEYAYARSLARFSADLGPVAWNIAAHKIQKALPSGVPFGPGWVGECEALCHTLLLHDKSNDRQTLVPNPAISKDFVENKDRLNIFAASRISSKQLCLSSTTAATTISMATTLSAGSPLTQSAGLHPTNDMRIKSPYQGAEHALFKSVCPVVESSELNMASSKLTSEVSQSRLLEIVSRNNKLMKWTSAKQAEQTQFVTGLQVKSIENFTIERRLDGTSSGIASEACDSSKLLSSSGYANIAESAIDPSVLNYRDRCQGIWAAQSSSQDHGMQDLSHLVSSSPGKILELQPRTPNMPTNTPVVGFSSSPSTLTTRSQEDGIVEAWVPSQTTDIAHADGNSRTQMLITYDAHYNAQARPRPSSRLCQFVQQQIPLDTPSYMQSQLSQLHSQSSSKLSQSDSQGGPSPIVESPTSNPMVHFAHVQEPAGPESPQNHHRTWQILPSQHRFQHMLDLSHSIPPDLNVGFHSSNSPVQQSSGLLVDSQQPDLALQL